MATGSPSKLAAEVQADADASRDTDGAPASADAAPAADRGPQTNQSEHAGLAPPAPNNDTQQQQQQHEKRQDNHNSTPLVPNGEARGPNKDGTGAAEGHDVHPPAHHQSAPAELKDKISSTRQALKDKSRPPPGGFDRTPLPNAPPGWTVRFGFIRAANLPPADIATATSDPFIHATLRTPRLPHRQPGDPELTYLTPTRRRTNDPDWNDSWVVANVPAAGFNLKCRLYDEDYPDHNDRLGNVTIKIGRVDATLGGEADRWRGPSGRELPVKKRVGSKRAYALQACIKLTSSKTEFTPSLWVSIEVLGPSDPPYAHIYTVGPTFFIKHYSPMIGRLAGTKVNTHESDDVSGDSPVEPGGKPKAQRYDFQANEMQLSGPVPPDLYHRYVEFRPIIGSMFSRHGISGKILNIALHKQHQRVYNCDKTTERALFEPRSQEASLQFLRLAHFDQGCRTFTYVLTLDGMLRFCETGGEFGIDLLSKHTMHSDVATYIACSGEFFIRRLARPDASDSPDPAEATHPPVPHLDGGPPVEAPPADPSYYQLIIDNDSGTYRPDKSILPQLKTFLEANLPGLGIVAMHWEDKKLKDMKKEQKEAKKKEGVRINMVPNSSHSPDSLNSTSDLDEMEREVGPDGDIRYMGKIEKTTEALEHPKKAVKIFMSSGRVRGGHSGGGDDGNGGGGGGDDGGSGGEAAAAASGSADASAVGGGSGQ